MINVYNLLERAGYKKTQLKIRDYIIKLDNVYMFEEKEAYVVVDTISEEKMKEVVNMILSYQNMISNPILTFNINIIYLFKSVDTETIAFKRLKNIYENDTNICRKIFLNIEDDDSMDLLPFQSVELDEVENNILHLRDGLTRIIDNNDFYSQLSSDDIDIDNVLKIINVGGKTNE